jgi:hypothetical protein
MSKIKKSFQKRVGSDAQGGRSAAVSGATGSRRMRLMTWLRAMKYSFLAALSSWR